MAKEKTKSTHTHHTHHHDPQKTKTIVNRMNRAIGHMESVRNMIADDRDCSEVLIQIAAVRSAITNIGKLILEDHIDHCIIHAVEDGDDEMLQELKEAIEKFMK